MTLVNIWIWGFVRYVLFAWHNSIFYTPTFPNFLNFPKFPLHSIQLSLLLVLIITVCPFGLHHQLKSWKVPTYWLKSFGSSQPAWFLINMLKTKTVSSFAFFIANKKVHRHNARFIVIMQGMPKLKIFCTTSLNKRWVKTTISHRETHLRPILNSTSKMNLIMSSTSNTEHFSYCKQHSHNNRKHYFIRRFGLCVSHHQE